jgi:hypothetical protein
MGNVLGRMGHLLKDIEGEWGEGIPHIQSLVVNMTGKLKNLPDKGIKEFWPEYPAMSYVEKAIRRESNTSGLLISGADGMMC